MCDFNMALISQDTLFQQPFEIIKQKIMKKKKLTKECNEFLASFTFPFKKKLHTPSLPPFAPANTIHV